MPVAGRLYARAFISLMLVVLGAGRAIADRILGNDETLRSIIFGSIFRQSGRMMQLHAFTSALCTCLAWICTAILGRWDVGWTGLGWAQVLYSKVDRWW